MMKAKMLRLIIVMFLVQAIGAVASAPVRAQNCDLIYEMIVELREPKWGAHNLWDTVYGEIDETEEFKGAVNSIDNREIVAVAEVTKKDVTGKQLLITQIDRRGRTVWEKHHKISGLDHVIKMLSNDKNYIVLAQTSNANDKKALWFGLFDKQGALIFSKAVSRKHETIEPKDFVLTKDGKTLLLTAQKGAVKGDNTLSTVFYWFSVSQKAFYREREFSLGAENGILGLEQSNDGKGYYAAGYIRGADRRMAGWVLKMDNEGGLQWQRQLKRGLGGRLYDIAEFAEDRYLIVSGEAFPADESEKKAAWVLAIDKDGDEIAWQRYYRENHNMIGRSLMAHEDGQISVLIDAKDSGVEDEKDYVRLITLNPRGLVLDNETYFNASGAGAYGFIEGANKERVLYGYSDVEFQIEKENIDMNDKEPVVKKKSRQAWLVAADTPNAYVDPCQKREMIIP